jgi:hypothetical protein
VSENKELRFRLDSLEKSEDFKRFMCEVLTLSHLMQSSMAVDRSRLEFLEGERSLGLKIFGMFNLSFLAKLIIEEEERNDRKHNNRTDSN